MINRIRIATRKSALAMWQANHVMGLLQSRYPGLEVELVPIVTKGDRILNRPLSEIGGKGLFLTELEQCMLDGGADLAVHSMKDMPAEMTGGLVLEVSLPRANPFDALIAGAGVSLQSLPAGSTLGTSSLRRQCQVLAARPDLKIVPLRGNVDTRLRKREDGEYDAIILAAAGLERLGLQQHISQLLEPPEWLPAATQGIIGLQCRDNDAATRELIAPFADTNATVQSQAERTIARMLNGSCQVPLAAYADVTYDSVKIDAMVGTPDGCRVLRATASGEAQEGVSLSADVAEDLLQQGAGEIIKALEHN